MPPTQIALEQSRFIVSEDKPVRFSVVANPLALPLLCLKLQIEVSFVLEGVGARTVEADVKVVAATRKGEFSYMIEIEVTPKALELSGAKNSGVSQMR